MSKDEAIKLALEALQCTEYPQDHYDAITALREALAEQPAQQEPGRNHYEDGDVFERIAAMKRQPAQQEPVLQDIEQYRLQMAGISTAAIGYWKESDGIHPDYDTIALRDVAKLYAEYDELSKAQNVPHGIIAGALFDFMGWLTSRPKRIMLSSVDDASPAVDAIRDFAKMRGLSLDDARVQDWQEALSEQPAQQEPFGYWFSDDPAVCAYPGSGFFPGATPPNDAVNVIALYTSPPAQRKPLTDEQIVAKALHLSGLGTSPDVIQFARAIEAAHGIKE